MGDPSHQATPRSIHTQRRWVRPLTLARLRISRAPMAMMAAVVAAVAAVVAAVAALAAAVAAVVAVAMVAMMARQAVAGRSAHTVAKPPHTAHAKERATPIARVTHVRIVD